MDESNGHFKGQTKNSKSVFYVVRVILHSYSMSYCIVYGTAGT
jgi:hypothetical protein